MTADRSTHERTRTPELSIVSSLIHAPAVCPVVVRFFLSVLQSGFEQQFKSHYIGNGYWRRSLEGNDIRQTNVPDIRIQFRAELLGDEFRSLQKHAKLPFTDALIDRII
jgi:hypothetical protein